MSEYYVYNGQTSTGLVLNNDSMYVSSGGTATETTVNSGGAVNVYSGGTATRTTINSSGGMTVSEGAFADSITLSSGGALGVMSGGTATNVDWTPFSGTVGIAVGAYITFANELSGVYYGSNNELVEHADVIENKSLYGWYNDMYVISGGTASKTTVGSAAKLRIYDGGLASDTNVGWNGKAYVYGGGSADGMTVSYGGSFELHSGGTLTNLTIAYDSFDICVVPGTYLQGTHGGKDFEMKDGVLSGFVYSDGNLRVSSGGIVDATTIGGGESELDYANLFVYDGGIASKTVANQESYVMVSSGGLALSTTLVSGGLLAVYNGGSAVDNLVHSGGYCYIRSGGVMKDTTAESNGRVYVSSGGTAIGTTLNNGGTFLVESRGVTSDTTVTGGGFDVKSGGKVTGVTTIAEGASAYIYAGGIFDFDISGLSPDNTALVNDISRIRGNPTFTLTVSDTQPDGSYLLAEGATTFNPWIYVVNSFGTNLGMLTLDSGTVIFDGVKYTLARSDSELVVTIANYIPDNGPDDGWNNMDKLWDKKAKKPVDGGIYDSGATILDKYYTSPILLDKPLTIDQSFVEHDGENITYNNFVGKITGGGFDPDTDDSDCGKFVLNTGARLSFNVTARTAGKFVIYKITETPDKKDPSKTNYSLKKIQTTSISVKKKTSYSTVSTKAVYLEAGTYFLSMETKINKKKDTECFYNVELNYAGTAKKPGAKFYSASDNSWNNYLYDSKTKTLNPSYFYTVSPGTGSYAVAIDNNSYYDSNTGRSWRNFVGFGDKTDFARLKPSSPVKLNFTVTATDASTFTVWSLTVKGKDKKTGNTLYTMKALKTIKLKKGEGGLYYAPVNELLLDRLSSSEDSNVGYYISMQSTSKKKDTEAYYDASVDSYAFQYADYGENKYLYDKKADPAHYNPSLYSNNVVAGAEPGRLMLETGGSLGVSREAGEEYKTYDNFVGFGDEWDYAEIELTSPGTCTFTVDAYSEGTVAKASPNLKFTVYSLTRVVKGETVTWKQKTLTSQTIAIKDKYVSGEPIKKTLEIKEATSDDVKYFVSMQSTGAKKGAEVFYNVTLGLTPPPDASALSMPETDSLADSLAMPDSLSLGQYDTDVLAGTSLDPASDNLFGESGSGLLASL